MITGSSSKYIFRVDVWEATDCRSAHRSNETKKDHFQEKILQQIPPDDTPISRCSAIFRKVRPKITTRAILWMYKGDIGSSMAVVWMFQALFTLWRSCKLYLSALKYTQFHLLKHFSWMLHIPKKKKRKKSLVSDHTSARLYEVLWLLGVFIKSYWSHFKRWPTIYRIFALGLKCGRRCLLLEARHW